MNDLAKELLQQIRVFAKEHSLHVNELIESSVSYYYFQYLIELQQPLMGRYCNL